MFRHIIVPLDGSALAESALVVAGGLAARLGSRVTLLHIIESDAPASVHGERHLTQPGEAEAYLEAIARGALLQGVATTIHVHTAPVARVAAGIAAHDAELAPDLIVMCSHGRGGLRQLLFGSIAQQVVGAIQTPLLLVRPRPGTPAASFACRVVLVPLDGDPSHQQGLAAAEGLSRSLGAQLRLLSIVPTLTTLDGQQAASSRFQPGATDATLQMACEEKRAFLAGELSRLRAAGVPATGEVQRGDPADTICAAADAASADLIVMGTHGKSGSRAFWAGSVAPRVLAKTALPVLLVPPRQG